MSRQTWSLPPATPLPDHRPSPGQIAGLIVLGCALGLILGWVGSTFAESQRQPDSLIETDPWKALIPGSAAGQTAVSLTFNGNEGTLQTGCGEFGVDYTQNGSTLTFSSLPPTPSSCSGSAANTHTWAVRQLADASSFTPDEFWREADTHAIVTLQDDAGGPLLTLTL